MSGKSAQAKKTDGEVQTTAERLAANVERLADALSSDIKPYDEAIGEGYAPADEIAESLGVNVECARRRLRRADVEWIKSKVPQKRLPEKFYRLSAP